MEIEFVKENIPPYDPPKFDIGRWPVCSECGQGTTGIPDQPPKCCPNAKHVTIRWYVEEKLKQKFNADEWKLTEEAIDLTKDVKLR